MCSWWEGLPFHRTLCRGKTDSRIDSSVTYLHVAFGHVQWTDSSMRETTCQDTTEHTLGIVRYIMRYMTRITWIPFDDGAGGSNCCFSWWWQLSWWRDHCREWKAQKVYKSEMHEDIDCLRKTPCTNEKTTTDVKCIHCVKTMMDFEKSWNSDWVHSVTIKLMKRPLTHSGVINS